MLIPSVGMLIQSVEETNLTVEGAIRSLEETNSTADPEGSR